MDNRIYKNSNQNPRNKSKKFKKRRNKGRGSIALSNSKLFGLVASRAFDKVASYFNTEDKYFDTNIATTIGTTYSATLLNGLSQGTDYNNRVGISVKSVSLLLRAVLNINSAATVDSFFRIVVIRDIQANSATVAQATIFETTSYNSLLRSDWLQRFVVYADRTMKLSVNGPSTQTLEVSIPMSFHTHYIKGSNLGTIADIATNALFLWVAGSDNVNQVTWNCNLRYFFIDN